MAHEAPNMELDKQAQHEVGQIRYTKHALHLNRSHLAVSISWFVKMQCF